MKIAKSLCLMALLCCAPATVMVTGCGGGSSNLPAGTVEGSYSGTYNVTSGPDANESGPISVTVQGDGNITGAVTDGSGNSATFTGTANTSTGRFTISGLFGQTGTSGQATGTIRADGNVVRGSGSFALTNGNSGTITFSKIDD